MSNVLTHPDFGTCVEMQRMYTNDRGITYVGGMWFAPGYSVYANLPATEVDVEVRTCPPDDHRTMHVWGDEYQCTLCGERWTEQVYTLGDFTVDEWGSKVYPTEDSDYPDDALDFDTLEALGFDGTGRDGHAPYRWSDPMVQEYVRQWIWDHQ